MSVPLAKPTNLLALLVNIPVKEFLDIFSNVSCVLDVLVERLANSGSMSFSVSTSSGYGAIVSCDSCDLSSVCLRFSNLGSIFLLKAFCLAFISSCKALTLSLTSSRLLTRSLDLSLILSILFWIEFCTVVISSMFPRM